MPHDRTMRLRSVSASGGSSRPETNPWAKWRKTSSSSQRKVPTRFRRQSFHIACDSPTSRASIGFCVCRQIELRKSASNNTGFRRQTKDIELPLRRKLVTPTSSPSTTHDPSNRAWQVEAVMSDLFSNLHRVGRVRPKRSTAVYAPQRVHQYAKPQIASG